MQARLTRTSLIIAKATINNGEFTFVNFGALNDFAVNEDFALAA